MPVDVLQDNNTVIQGHADGKRYAGKRDHIDGSSADKQPQERGQRADGDTHGADEGGRWGSQEKKQDHDDQQGADKQVITHVQYGIRDVSHVLGVEYHVHAMLLQQAVVQLLHFFHDVILHFDHVGADLPAYPDADVRYTPPIGVGLDFKGGQFSVTQVAQADKRAVTLGDDQIFYLCRGFKTSHRPNQVTAFTAVQIAAGYVTVTRADNIS